ncbi:MAG: hypothetical protein ACK5NB_11255 [Flavobacteriaceae bacterium]
MKTLTKDTNRIKNNSNRTDWSSTYNRLSNLRNRSGRKSSIFESRF